MRITLTIDVDTNNNVSINGKPLYKNQYNSQQNDHKLGCASDTALDTRGDNPCSYGKLTDYLNKDATIIGTARNGARRYESLPLDILKSEVAKADLDSVTIAQGNIPGTPGRVGSRGPVKRTNKYPYISADIKNLIKNFKVPYTKIAEAIGVNVTDLYNALATDCRQFTKEDFNVILKAITLIYTKENKEVELL